VIINKFNIAITSSEVRKFIGKDWLNDNLINFLTGMLHARNLQKEVNSIHYFNTHFASQIMADATSWCKFTKHVDVFSKTMLFIPINVSNTHWCLAVANMTEKKLILYDSFSGFSSGMWDVFAKNFLDVLTNVAAAAAAAVLDLNGFDRSLWSAHKYICPQQDNGSDCGVFCSIFMILLTDDVGLDSVCFKDMPFLRNRLFNDVKRGLFRF
jgi:sentrin-specific protease 1